MGRLVVSRKELETVSIDGHGFVTVRVVRIKGNRVSLAIEAEPETVILRGEIAERKDSTHENA